MIHLIDLIRRANARCVPLLAQLSAIQCPLDFRHFAQLRRTISRYFRRWQLLRQVRSQQVRPWVVLLSVERSERAQQLLAPLLLQARQPVPLQKSVWPLEQRCRRLWLGGRRSPVTLRLYAQLVARELRITLEQLARHPFVVEITLHCERAPTVEDVEFEAAGR